MKTVAIIPAGGAGKRLKARVFKQYLHLDHLPVHGARHFRRAFVGGVHDDQGPVRCGEGLHRRMQHLTRPGTHQDALRLQILAARQRRVKVVDFLVVVPARSR